MIDPSSYSVLKDEVSESIASQRNTIEELRNDVRPLKNMVRRIKPRSTTSISIVGTDGGSNQVVFDPFLLQVVRVVDSTEQDHCLEVVATTSDLTVLRKRHLSDSGEAFTPLGRMMQTLDVKEFHDLSSMIPSPPKPPKPSWISVYRELQEWAILLDLISNRNFVSDTLIMRDGWLRTKVFEKGLFNRFRQIMEDAIVHAHTHQRRRIYLAAVLKQSKVIQKYQLALALEGILRTNYPSYVPVPTELQHKVFEWGEIVGEKEGGRPIKDSDNMVAGDMFLVKFGSRPGDRIWAVDVLKSQVDDVSTILGYMLADAEAGFPQTFFPMSLQRAHEHANVGGLDGDILRMSVSDGVRRLLGDQQSLVDEFELMEESETGSYA